MSKQRRLHTMRDALICILLISVVLVCAALFTTIKQGVLTVAFLDVGQGDAIYIETPSGRQVLIDGGKGRDVLRALGDRMSFTDRSIDVVIATHPDIDHIGGLPEVFKRFVVSTFIESGVDDDGADYRALLDAVESEGLEGLYAQAGMMIELDEGVQLTIFSPAHTMRSIEANRSSVVAQLVYGDTRFLFTGDAPIGIEEYLVGRYGATLQSDVLKLGHHGSKTSTSELFLTAVQPRYAVVSAGCDNAYGHPHSEVIARIVTAGAEVVETCGSYGGVVFESDGTNVTHIKK